MPRQGELDVWAVVRAFSSASGKVPRAARALGAGRIGAYLCSPARFFGDYEDAGLDRSAQVHGHGNDGGNDDAEEAGSRGAGHREGKEALLNRVALRHDEFIIERKGKPLAALVPVARFEQIRRFARSTHSGSLAPLLPRTLRPTLRVERDVHGLLIGESVTRSGLLPLLARAVLDATC